MKKLLSGEPLGCGGPGPSAPRGGGGGGGASAQLSARPAAQAQPLPDPQTFEQTVALIEEKRDIGLAMDVQRYVKPIAFKPGAVTFEPAPGAPHDLARRLAARLKEWTGRTWLIAANGQGGGETLIERDRREKDAARQAILNDPFVQAVMQVFPGAELGEVRALAPAAPETPEIPDEAPDED